MRKTHWAAVLCVIGLLAAWGVGAYADLWYVNIEATGANNGTSWENAYTDLQTALTAARSGDKIWVAEGTYKPTSPAGRYATFQLKTGVALYGGFAGTETARSQRNWESHETILSGDLGAAGDLSDDSYHVLTGSGTDDTAVLDGFTIKAGNADGVNPHNYGGGMLIAPGSPIVSNCTFVGNTAESGGGMAVAASGADPTLMNCTFRDNSTIKMPGTLSGGGGGGMVIFEYASVTVTYCSFDSNFGYFGGGIDLDIYSSAVVTHCLFTGNTAGAGGGLCTNVSVVSLSNCTFSGNTAYYGGGMRIIGSSSSLTAIYCTLSENTAGGEGGGISISGDATVSVGAVLVADNTAIDGPDIEGAVISNGHNFIGDATGCTGLGSTDIIGQEPLLGPLANNGGHTLTRALLPGSPAIDAVPSTASPSIVTDQRGVARPSPTGGNCDIGAYEASARGDLNCNSVLDLLDVRLCLQIATGVIPGTLEQRAAADVDGDGDVDLTDAQILAEYIIGIRSALSGGG